MFFYGIKDTLAQAMLQLFPAQKVELVKRDLSNVVNDPQAKSNLAKNPQDFELWCLGSVNEETGAITDNAINNIIVDRYGYTWTGWYFIYQNYANSVIYSDKTKNVNSYFNFSEEYRIISGISERADNTIANAKVFTNQIFSIILVKNIHIGVFKTFFAIWCPLGTHIFIIVAVYCYAVIFTFVYY